MKAVNSGQQTAQKLKEFEVSRTGTPFAEETEEPRARGTTTMKQSLRLVLIGRNRLGVCAITNAASAQPLPPQPPAGPIAAPPPPPPGAPFALAAGRCADRAARWQDGRDKGRP